MTLAPFRVVPLDAAHDRAAFNCGSAALDRYLSKRVRQDVRRRVTKCFVALAGDKRIAAYYTLAAASLRLTDLPVQFNKELPRYPFVPVVRIGRLAVDQEFKGQGLGGAILADALDRVLHSEIAAFGLLVDAKDEQAANFYRHHEFITLPHSDSALFLPIVSALLAQVKA